MSAHSEILSDFSAPWCQNLLNSPDLINTTTPTRLEDEPPGDRLVTNLLYSKTFKTDTTIRAWQSFQAKHTEPSNAGPAYFLLLSLGSDLNGVRGILHGGMSSALMDQSASTCAVSTAGPAVVTAQMTLSYKNSVPVPSVVLCRSVLSKREGRRLYIQGRIEDGMGKVYCEAENIFVVVKKEEKL